MSELMLPVGLVATFLAVGLLTLAMQTSVARRRRAVELLEAHVSTAMVNTREEELGRSFMERVLVPVLSALGAVGMRLTPIGMRKRIGRKLILMGNPEGWTAEKVAALKVIGAIAGAGLGASLAATLGLEGFWRVGAILFLGTLGMVMPGATVDMKMRTRQETIRRQLPDVMDLLTISVEAGLGFDAAMAQVVKSTDGPLPQEIGRVLQEIQVGSSRADALRHMADRTDVQDIKGFVLAMIQAEQFGISISKVLRSQSKQLRTKRRQRAEEKAMKVPVKILFPLIFCILPAMFVVLIGPGIIRIVRDFLGLV